MILGWGLIVLTSLLVVGGCALYVLDLVGWAQMLWVMASGSAGAGMVLLIEEHKHGGRG
jgi:hypothetical protein